MTEPKVAASHLAVVLTSEVLSPASAHPCPSWPPVPHEVLSALLRWFPVTLDSTFLRRVNSCFRRVYSSFPSRQSYDVQPFSTFSLYVLSFRQDEWYKLSTVYSLPQNE